MVDLLKDDLWLNIRWKAYVDLSGSTRHECEGEVIPPYGARCQENRCFSLAIGAVKASQWMKWMIAKSVASLALIGATISLISQLAIDPDLCNMMIHGLLGNLALACPLPPFGCSLACFGICRRFLGSAVSIFQQGEAIGPK